MWNLGVDGVFAGDEILIEDEASVLGRGGSKANFL